MIILRFSDDQIDLIKRFSPLTWLIHCWIECLYSLGSQPHLGFNFFWLIHFFSLDLNFLIFWNRYIRDPVVESNLNCEDPQFGFILCFYMGHRYLCTVFFFSIRTRLDCIEHWTHQARQLVWQSNQSLSSNCTFKVFLTVVNLLPWC